MPTELTCSRCGDSATVELRERIQLGNEAARLYFPEGEIKEEVSEQLLLNAKRTWYEWPSAGKAFCSGCMVDISGDGLTEDDLGRLEDGKLRFSETR